MKPIRILYTVQSGKMGGAEHSLYYLIKTLDRKLFSPTVWFLERGGELEIKLKEIKVPTAVLGLNLEIKNTRWRRFTNPLALLQTGCILKKAKADFTRYFRENGEGFDLVHTNSWLVNNLVLLTDLPLPVIWNVRDLSRPRLHATLVQRAAKVVCVSEAVRNLIYQQEHAAKFKVIYNGIDLAVFKPDAALRRKGREMMGLAENELAIGLFGRLTPLKGQAFFLESLASYLKEQTNVKIIIVGESLFDKIDYRPLLEDLALKGGITSQVVFMGAQQQMPTLLNGIDVYVHPTTTKDAFPRATLEAMATAKPTIAARLGGIVEQIQDGEDGLLFTPNDAASLKSCLQKLLENPAFGQTLGQNGQKRVARDFNLKDKTREMEQVYQETMER